MPDKKLKDEGENKVLIELVADFRNAINGLGLIFVTEITGGTLEAETKAKETTQTLFEAVVKFGQELEVEKGGEIKGMISNLIDNLDELEEAIKHLQFKPIQDKAVNTMLKTELRRAKERIKEIKTKIA